MCSTSIGGLSRGLELIYNLPRSSQSSAEVKCIYYRVIGHNFTCTHILGIHLYSFMMNFQAKRVITSLEGMQNTLLDEDHYMMSSDGIVAFLV